MKKHLLSLVGATLMGASAIAQFSAGGIWSLNLRVDPMPHNTITIVGIPMSITYNAQGVPLTGLSNSSNPGFPTFRITSTVNGNTTVCVSGEKEGNDPWEDYERATFSGDASGDTSITVEESNNGGPFENRNKITIERATNPNQFTHFGYTWTIDGWKLISKGVYYLSNSRIDSLVGFKVDGSNLTRTSYTVFYYSNGLDSSLQNVLQTTTNQFELANKIVVTAKEGAKTKSFAIFARNGSGMPLQQTGTILYSNSTPNALHENALNNNFSVYPNPARELVNVIALDNETITNINFFDISGNKLNTMNNIENNKGLLNISNLSSGIYFIEITTNKGTATKKIIID